MIYLDNIILWRRCALYYRYVPVSVLCVRARVNSPVISLCIPMLLLLLLYAAHSNLTDFSINFTHRRRLESETVETINELNTIQPIVILAAVICLPTGQREFLRNLSIPLTRPVLVESQIISRNDFSRDIRYITLYIIRVLSTPV